MIEQDLNDSPWRKGAIVPKLGGVDSSGLTVSILVCSEPTMTDPMSQTASTSAAAAHAVVAPLWAMAPPPRAPGDNNPGVGVISKTRTELKRPKLYRVLLLNDDYTPMDFVVEVLQRFFNKDHDEATQIMLHVHHSGVGECGIYTFEVAETKVTLVMEFAIKHQHPLHCVMEEK